MAIGSRALAFSHIENGADENLEALVRTHRLTAVRQILRHSGHRTQVLFMLQVITFYIINQTLFFLGLGSHKPSPRIVCTLPGVE